MEKQFGLKSPIYVREELFLCQRIFVVDGVPWVTIEDTKGGIPINVTGKVIEDLVDEAEANEG